MASPIFDMLIRDEDGQLIATTEVKAYQDLSSDVAIDLRKTLVEHGVLPKNIFFLLVSQDKGYLWKEDGKQSIEQAPITSFSMDEIIQHYAKDLASLRLRETELALLILQWLFDLSAGGDSGIDAQEMTPSLTEFLKSVRGATIITEDAA